MSKVEGSFLNMSHRTEYASDNEAMKVKRRKKLRESRGGADTARGEKKIKGPSKRR